MSSENDHPAGQGGKSRRWLIVAGIAAAVLLLAILLPRPDANPAPPSTNALQAGSPPPDVKAVAPRLPSHPGRKGAAMSLAEAQQVITNKLNQFARSRLAIAEAMAKKLGLELPPEIRDFFATIQTGDWEKIKPTLENLRELRRRSGDESYNRLWGPILESYGVAEVVHDWPADKLLDYGNAVLGSLKPGAVYVGGTDPGRFIPTLLNETTDGERHIVLTQNALADNSYTEYLRFLYSDQMATLGNEQCQKAFSDYIADAQKRVAHDQQFPNEPKQVRPGEDIKITDKISVSGQVAVMAINERMLQMIMDSNPNLRFAMEESFPFQSLYSNAVPMGPLMELRSDHAASAYTPDAAAGTLDYWRTTAAEIGSDPNLPADSKVREAYAKLALGQAHLFSEHNSPTEAEQAYRYALDINPGNSEGVFSYVNLLLKQNRAPDAVQVVEAALQAKPDNQQMRSLIDQLRKMPAK